MEIMPIDRKAKLCELARCSLDRQRKVKGRARSRVGGPQAAAVRLDDGPPDRQSHPRTLRLGGNEGIEDVLCLFRLDSGSGCAPRNRFGVTWPKLCGPRALLWLPIGW